MTSRLTPTELKALHDLVDTWAAGLSTTAPAPSKPVQGVGAPRGKLTFEDTFDKLNWDVWDSIFNHSDPSENGCTLLGNGERQWYPNHRRRVLYSPWSVLNGVLRLTAHPATAVEKAAYGYSRPDLKTVGTHEYVSGLLSSHRSFSQQYGYFEIEAQMPAGRGLWPAFWMKAQSGDWPPEIDIFEVLGHEPNKLYTTVHYDKDDKKTGIEAWVDTTKWHRYGLLWTSQSMRLWIDDAPAGGGVIPNKVNEPMHFLLNLAVGGSWPEQAGPVDPKALPATLQVRSVRAWALTL